jgi:hypothetical protein
MKKYLLVLVGLGLLVSLGCETTKNKKQAKAVNTNPTVKKIKGGAQQVVVDARGEWINTGIQVQEGQKLKFKAKGDWGESAAVKRNADGGPAGLFGSGYWGAVPIIPDKPYGALIGRIGGQIFYIGTANTIKAQQGDELQLAINDAPGNFEDNHGEMVVTIRKLN